MDPAELHRHVRSMHELVASGERDEELRSEADAAFRSHYRTLRGEWDALPAAVAAPVKEAFLALVGSDDWTSARRCLSAAMDRSA